MTKPLNLVLWCAVISGFGLATQDAYAGGKSKKKWKLNPPAGVKDMHVSVGGTITKSTVTPAPDGGEQSNLGSYDCAWNSAMAGTETVEIELERNGQGKWGSYWWTYDGKLGAPGGLPSGALASLNLGDTNSSGLIYADNQWGAGPLNITNVTATIEHSLDDYDSPDWEQTIGTDIPLPDISLAAGQTQIPLSPISFDSNQWLKITADFNGQTQVFGYTQVPEPASLALLACGAIAAIRRCR